MKSQIWAFAILIMLGIQSQAAAQTQDLVLIDTFYELHGEASFEEAASLGSSIADSVASTSYLPDTEKAQFVLAFAESLYRTKRYEEALAALNSGFEFLTQMSYGNDLMLMEFHRLRADTANHLGLIDIAIDDYNNAWEISKRIYGEDHPNTAPHVESLIEFYEGFSDFDDVRADLQLRLSEIESNQRLVFESGTDLTNRSGEEGVSELIDVFYGTNRNKRKKSADIDGFGNRLSKSDQLDVGIVQVSIPKHHLIGAVERPSIWRLELRPDANKHVLLTARESLSIDNFYQAIRTSLANHQSSHAILFVHGYGTSFAEAAQRTAQLSYDLDFDGPALMFSWPGSGLGRDSNSGEWGLQASVDALQRFVESLRDQSQVVTLHVVAHGLGSKLALDALTANLRQGGPDTNPQIGQLVFATPDISQSDLETSLPLLRSASDRITLYASSRDRVLNFGRLLESEPPVGFVSVDGSNLLQIDGVDAIDTGQADTNFLSDGHVRNQPDLAADLGALVLFNLQPERRCYLARHVVQAIPTWRINPNQCNAQAFGAALRLTYTLGYEAAVKKAEERVDFSKYSADPSEGDFWREVVLHLRESVDDLQPQ